LAGYYGPPFHNFGGARLTNAWPWIGQALTREGFQTHGLPSLCLHRTLDSLLEPLPLPPDAKLQRDWVTQIGIRDTTEYGYQLFVGNQRAGEVMVYFAEKFARGTGFTSAYIFWLGVNPGFRGRGFGRLLLRQALIEAQQTGAREVAVRTGTNNFDALAIYRAEGFTPVDIQWELERKG